MDRETRYEQMHQACLAYGQEHLLRYYAELSPEARSRLLDQLESIDFEAVRTMYQEARRPQQLSGSLAPMPAQDWEQYSTAEKQQYTELGMELLRQGCAGAIVVAGGQGSRLGHDGPKGTLSIGLPSGKSLFQLQAERLLTLSRLAGRSIPWYIMTSPDNHKETVRFFEQHSYFGYVSSDIYFFTQAVLPAVDLEGRILLSAKDQISLAPSGNGEVFASLHSSGAIADMKRRGLQWLFYYNVDNALIQIADPRFLGVAAFHHHPVATKAAIKAYPEEKVGILCKRNGRPAVVEYTDVPNELMHATDAEGRLLYGLGNISIHFFHFDWLEQHALTKLSYHAAFKKLSFLSPDGKHIQPEEPNAYKFERFIFDFFPLAEQMTVVLMNREEEFAPVKNKSGEDSPETARALILELHRRWLERAGRGSESSIEAPVEISPLVSYGGEGLS